MSVLYLAFDTDERPNRMAKLQKSGAHVVVAEPRWPGFFELAKREKPYAIAIDFHEAPSHSLETADYLSKAKETKETALTALFLLRVPADRLEVVQKRLPHATVTTEQELSGRLSEMERQAEARAREKKEAAAAAKKAARAANAAAKAAAAGKPPKPAAPAKPAAKAKPAPGAAKKKPVAKKSAPSSAKKAHPKKKK
jgi:hypothetical protein